MLPWSPPPRLDLLRSASPRARILRIRPRGAPPTAACRIFSQRRRTVPTLVAGKSDFWGKGQSLLSLSVSPLSFPFAPPSNPMFPAKNARSIAMTSSWSGHSIAAGDGYPPAVDARDAAARRVPRAVAVDARARRIPSAAAADVEVLAVRSVSQPRPLTAHHLSPTRARSCLVWKTTSAPFRTMPD